MQKGLKSREKEKYNHIEKKCEAATQAHPPRHQTCFGVWVGVSGAVECGLVRFGGDRLKPHSDHKCGLGVVCGLECGLECGLGAVWCGLVRSGLPPTQTACALVVWEGRLVWSECGLSRALPDHARFVSGLGPKA